MTELDRLSPAESHKEDKDRSQRVEMTDWIGGQAAERARKPVALKVRCKRMGVLMQCDREDDPCGQEKERQWLDGSSVEQGKLKRAGHGSVL